MRALWMWLLLLPVLAAQPVPAIAPASLKFVYQIGQYLPADQGVVLASPVATVVDVPRVNAAPWLVTYGLSASLQANRPVFFQIGVDPRGLGVGAHTATLNFISGGVTQSVDVTLQITGGAVLVTDFGIALLDVTGAPAGTCPVQTVAAATSNGTPLLMSVTTTAPWLITKVTGSTIQISCDRTKAPGGVSGGTVTATATTTGISPLSIPVIVVTQPAITRVTHSASFVDGPIAPGEIITLGGPNLGPPSLTGLALDGNGNVATALAGTQVLINGVASPLVYAANSQISAVVPYQTAGQSSVPVQVISNGIISNSVSQNIVPAAPGLYTADSSGQGQGAILNSDLSVNSRLNPAAAGSTVVLYGTGEGQTDPAGVTGRVTPISALTPTPVLKVTATVDGQPADILFAGEAPGFVSGVLQVNVRIPPGTRSGDVPVVLSVGGNLSPSGVTVSVR